MNKFLATTALVGTLFAISTGASFADNSSDTGDVRLTGTMPAICAIEIDTKNTSLDMKAGASKQVVAQVKETCNDHQGYTISFTSANAGTMLHADSGQAVAYTVNYDSAANSSLDKSLILTRAKEAYGVEHDLVVNMSGSSNRVAGTYRDTITVQIAAK